MDQLPPHRVRPGTSQTRPTAAAGPVGARSTARQPEGLKWAVSVRPGSLAPESQHLPCRPCSAIRRLASAAAADRLGHRASGTKRRPRKNRVTILASAYPNRRSPHNCRRPRLTGDDQFNVSVLAVRLACTCAVAGLGKCTASVGSYPQPILSRGSAPESGIVCWTVALREIWATIPHRGASHALTDGHPCARW